jgi:predicted metalloprotease
MRWQDFGRSDNVEDRRGGGGMAGKGGLGVGTMVVLGLLGWALGIDPRLLIGGAEQLVGSPATGERDSLRQAEARPL